MALTGPPGWCALLLAETNEPAARSDLVTTRSPSPVTPVASHFVLNFVLTESWSEVIAGGVVLRLRLAGTHEFSYFWSREFTADHILKGLSRRRPRVQVPSTPLKLFDFLLFLRTAKHAGGRAAKSPKLLCEIDAVLTGVARHRPSPWHRRQAFLPRHGPCRDRFTRRRSRPSCRSRRPRCRRCRTAPGSRLSSGLPSLALPVGCRDRRRRHRCHCGLRHASGEHARQFFIQLQVLPCSPSQLRKIAISS